MADAPALSLLVLRSEAPERAITFYRALGIEFEQHRHGRGPEHFASTNTAYVLEVYPSEEPSTPIRLGFTVVDVDATVRELQRLGTEVRLPPGDSEWGRRAVVRDLDGNAVELIAGGACGSDP